MSGSNSVCYRNKFNGEFIFTSASFDSIGAIDRIYADCGYGGIVSLYGGFCVECIRDGDVISVYIGCEGSYVDYGGVRYEGESGMYRLMDILEREKIRNLLGAM